MAVLIASTTVTSMLIVPSAAAQPSLDDQLAAAEAELDAAQARLAKTFQAFATADQRHKDAAKAAQAAAGAVTKTRAEATAATEHERRTRLEFDEFAAASYQQRSSIGSIRAYLGAKSPGDLLDRASMVRVLAGEYVDVMDTTSKAVDRKSTADRQAQSALESAVTNRDAAAKAKTEAERAYRTAVDIQDAAKAETARLAERRAQLSGGGSGEVVLPAQGTFTSGYGARGGAIHFGIDIANSIGTPILSAMAGEVIDSGPASGFGLWVRVQHPSGEITVYGHIDQSLVSVGQQVAAGEQIATMGNRGQSTGPHLHFEVHENGNKIDPLPWLRGHGINL
ncbi:M23 family metallopeptidase [Actinophytocola xinjiangensis]|uniref:M23 family metallopeptidase n=1 Tax=Actinophytocola xinjiangensis TaxID=485602 RepID=UPI001FE958F2|nr:M23 family metallopeptidase [Actinophytocola xinjiangensis]